MKHINLLFVLFALILILGSVNAYFYTLDGHGQGMSTGGTNSDEKDYSNGLQAKSNFYVYGVQFQTGLSNDWYAYFYDASDNLLGSCLRIDTNNACYFDAPIQITNGNNYRVRGYHAAGSSSAFVWTGGISYPISATYFNWIATGSSLSDRIMSFSGIYVTDDPGASVTSSYNYTIDKTNAEIDLNDTSTSQNVTIDTWTWDINGTTESTDQNFSYSTTQNIDLNICLTIEDSTDTYQDTNCNIINTGSWYDFTNNIEYDINRPATTINLDTTSAMTFGTITGYKWTINDVVEATTKEFAFDTAEQLTDYNICSTLTAVGSDTSTYYDTNCIDLTTLDWDPPTTFATAAQISGFSKANVNITCNDNNSGCDRVYYKFNSGAWVDTNDLPIDLNYSNIGANTLYWYGVDLAGNIEDTNNISFTITADTTPPTIDFETNIVTPGFIADYNIGLTLTCWDNRLDDINYLITKTNAGGTITVSNTQDVNGTVKTIYDDLNIGLNVYYARCIDFNGNQSAIVESNTIYAVAFNLINEETGENVTDLNTIDVATLQAFTYDGNNVYDYNIYSPPVKIFVDYDNVVRFDITYDDVSETKLSREIDFGLLPDTNIGLCIAPFQSFYEQFLISSTSKDVVVYNDFADCYNLASTTKFAYENALMVRAFTINKPYYLYTWVDEVKTLLATIDGSKASVINLDVLEFNKETYEFEIATDTVVFKCLENTSTGICDQNTMSIYYKSLRADNATTTYKVYNGNNLLWEYTEEDEPNEFNTNWYYGDNDLNATTVLKLVLTKTSEAGVSSSADYWFNLEGQTFSGTMPASLAIIFSFLLLFVGLTLVAYRYAFGWFGIFLCIVAIGILSFAPGFWYVQFMQAIMVIVAVFITIVYANNAGRVN